MSLLDNFKRNFGIGSKRAEAEINTDDAAPGGLNMKPDGGAGATTLNKRPIIFGTAAIALVAAGAFGGFALIEHAKPKINLSARIAPGRRVKVALPPSPPKPVPKQVVSSASSAHRQTAKQQTPQQSTTAYQAPSPPPPVAQQPPPPTPQQKAAEAALEQQMIVSNSSGVWGNQQKPAPAMATPEVHRSKSSESGAGVYDAHIERRPASHYELMAGSVIPAVLTTSIQSDLPGQITAQVSRDVFDSESGAYLLIPAGAKLVGVYGNKIIAGQTRVGVDWTRIIMPNGSYISLGIMPGAGPSGKDGLHDLVNDHTWEIFKNALLMSVIDLGISVSQPGYGASGGIGQTAVTPAQEGEASLAQTFGQAEAGILQRYTNIAPTLVIRAGYQLNVAVTKDVVFPAPYNQRGGSAYRGSDVTRQIAPAAVMNPYPVGR